MTPSFCWVFDEERVYAGVLLEVEGLIGGASEAWLCGDPGPALAQVREAVALLEGLEDRMVEELRLGLGAVESKEGGGGGRG